MRHFLVVFFMSVLGLYQATAQDFSSLWTAHYSYNTVVDVVEGGDILFAAAENAVFAYDTVADSFETITSVNGLSGQAITTIYYSELYQLLIIGYQTGLIEIYNTIDSSVLSVVDILDKQNITPLNKTINHFYENNGFLYISAGFGVSVFDLENFEFGDTYFLGNGGAQISVSEVTIFNDNIYAACLNNNGLKQANINNPNLVDSTQWLTIESGNFLSAQTFNNRVYAVNTTNQVFEVNMLTALPVLNLDFQVLDAKVVDSQLIYTFENSVQVFNLNMQLQANYGVPTDLNTTYTSAVSVNNNLYIATTNNGVLQPLDTTLDTYDIVLPNGPTENSIFRLASNGDDIWASYGEYTSQTLNPFPLTSKGISQLIDNEWVNTSFDSVLSIRELNHITPNPFNTSQVFISSFFEGILVMENNEAVTILNQNNSGLESLILPNDPNYVDIRVSATGFDPNGLLWSITSRVDNALKAYNPISGNWQSYSFGAIIEDPLNDENGFYDLAVGQDGTKWIGSNNNGLIGYNETKTNPIKNLNTQQQGVDPFTRFRALAVDQNNQLWIGTTKGLKVLNNASGFFEDPNAELDIIVIIEDGVPKELLEAQTITDIVVDGANNKWIGTTDSGVFYVSANGQNTIHQFNINNSPLPSNVINNIAINATNGEVFIATNRGMLSFNSGGTSSSESLEKAYVYPNPVRPEYNILGANDLNDITKGIKVLGLTDRVNIKITDITGNLVAEAQSNINLRTSSANFNFAIDGGTAIWNGKNLANNVVQTGVYLILISDLDSFETKVLKVLIVR